MPGVKPRGWSVGWISGSTRLSARCSCKERSRQTPHGAPSCPELAGGKEEAPDLWCSQTQSSEGPRPEAIQRAFGSMHLLVCVGGGWSKGGCVCR